MIIYATAGELIHSGERVVLRDDGLVMRADPKEVVEPAKSLAFEVTEEGE